LIHPFGETIDPGGRYSDIRMNIYYNCEQNYDQALCIYVSYHQF